MPNWFMICVLAASLPHLHTIHMDIGAHEPLSESASRAAAECGAPLTARKVISRNMQHEDTLAW
jgi:hypothetical protein